MRSSNGLLMLAAAGAVGTVASIAAGQPTACQSANGPDVTVGSLMAANNGNDTTGNMQNYTATGGFDAFSMGTYSLNVGKVWVNWFQTTNQHPVIGQNCFKYKVVNGAGRFEQLGQSWLKHGFFALSDTVWCPVCTSTDGTHLGVGCSDPYTANRNGGQSGAGPKWQVNAHTGAFTYPPANPAFSGTVARRLAVSTADLEPSSAAVRFFGEGQYVSPDDSLAGNQNNNVSYRELTVAGTTDFTFSFSLPVVGGNDYKTRREQPAIKAWKTIDASVTETTFDIPTDGRIIVSSKATDLGGGTWHYEYAVYNMNSDQSIGTFSVPVPDSASVTNIGFRDVSYRDGDGIGNVNIDGTDWPSSRASNKITWTTSTFAANANGNSIRWGTMHNFRFDANVAPAASGNASMSTWKVVNSYNVAAQIPGAGSPTACYANCDASTLVPFLNVNDFTCFLNKFAAGDTYANCDQSTLPPVLNVNDFSCFTNAFAAGCANP